MSDFISELRNVENKSQKKFCPRKEKFDELKSICDEFAEKYVEDVKRQLLDKVSSHNKSYDVDVLFGKKMEHNPIYEVNISFAFTFDCFSPDFKKADIYFPYNDFGTPGFITHSPDLIIYLIKEISQRLIQNGIVPFYWKTKRHSYKKHVQKTNYPTSEHFERINDLYKEMSAAAKRNDTRTWDHWKSMILMSFKVDAR